MKMWIFIKSDVWRILKWMGLGLNIVCLAKLLGDTMFVLALSAIGTLIEGARQGVDVFNYRVWWFPQSIYNVRYWATSGIGILFGSSIWWILFQDEYGRWGIAMGLMVGVFPLIAYYFWELYESITGREKEDLGFYVT